jgi:hypothetical protein
MRLRPRAAPRLQVCRANSYVPGELQALQACLPARHLICACWCRIALPGVAACRRSPALNTSFTCTHTHAHTISVRKQTAWLVGRQRGCSRLL